MKRPIPINEAEAIFEPFWDPDLSELSKYTVQSGALSNAKVEQYWCYAANHWDHGKPGETVLVMSRSLDLVLSGYDRVVLAICEPRDARVTLRCKVDGAWCTPIADAPCTSETTELDGPVPGGTLEALEISLRAGSEGPGAGWVMWIGCAHAARRAQMLAREAVTVFAPDWPGCVVPEGTPLSFEPALGLYFGAGEMAGIRARAQRPGYSVAMEGIRRAAREAMKGQPERRVGSFQPTQGLFQRERDRQPEMYSPATACAFVGLVDRDPAHLRMAARYALSLAHMRSWTEGPLEVFPGSAWEQRSFRETLATDACAMVLDWAGEILTPHGRDLLREAIAMKGLPRIQVDYLKHEYIHHMNQAVWFSRGRMLGLLALAKAWPRAEVYLQGALEDLQAVLEDTTLEDGGCGEPPGYFFCNGMFGMPALAAYARHKGLAVRDLVPPRLARSIQMISAVASTAPRGGVLAVGDSTDLMDADTAALFARYLPDPRWTRLLHDRLSLLANPPPGDKRAGVLAAFGAGSLVVALGPDEEPGETPVVPVFRILPNTGLLVSSRPWEDGVVRLQLMGAPEGCGHSHEDKGSIVLEALGDPLLIDRGIGSYYDARSALTKYATAHNLLVPVLADDGEPHQVNPAPPPIRPTGRGDERSFEGAVETTTVWGGQVERHVRSLRSETPEVIRIEDDATLPRPGAVALHFQSLFPIVREGRGWIIRGERSRLEITTEWDATERRCREDGLNGGGRPVWHLELRAPASKCHRLSTVLTLERRE